MRKDQRALLLALAIGDGYVQKFKKHRKDKDGNLLNTYEMHSLVLHHSSKQREYVEYKAGLIQSIFGGKKPSLTPCSQYLKVTGKEYQMLKVSKAHKYLKVIRRLLYPEGVKKLTKRVLDQLTPQGLAIWYMDDGSLKANRNKQGRVSSVSMTISTYCSLEEASLICDVLKANYDVEFKPAFHSRFNSHYIRANTANAKKFAAIVEPFIVDSMRYKIDFALECNWHERGAPLTEVMI